MSRVRFHGIRAIGKLCELTWSGNGWENYDSSKTVQENIDLIYGDQQPDVVIAYKPLELKEFSKIKPIKCIRYNEMYDVEWTIKEITESKSNLIVCHHKNDMEQYIKMFQSYKEHPVKFVNIPHCAEKIIYRDYGMPKEYDILLAGAVYTKSLLGDHYPLRIRLAQKILPIMSRKYNCKILQHPGGNLVEIPMCGSVLSADMPGEEQEKFNQFMIEIDMHMSDEEIINKLTYYLENEKERQKLVDKGYEYAVEYTQEKYAEKFLEVVNELE